MSAPAPSCCAECGKRDGDGWALYCVDCISKIGPALAPAPEPSPVQGDAPSIDEAARNVLDARDRYGWSPEVDDAMGALRIALAQQVQEPQPESLNAQMLEALKRMVESITGVDQVSAVNEARAAITAAEAVRPKTLDDPRLQELFSATIDGALTTGYQGGEAPPVGHWLTFWYDKGRSVAAAEAAQAGSAQQVPAVPEGWRLVPVEATDEMADAGDNESPVAVHSDWTARDVWDAMLAAAPLPTPEKPA